jgi:hypothetical protein
MGKTKAQVAKTLGLSAIDFKIIVIDTFIKRQNRIDDFT